MTDEQWVAECEGRLEKAWPQEPRSIIEWVARSLLRNARHLSPEEAVTLAQQIYQPPQR